MIKSARVGLAIAATVSALATESGLGQDQESWLIPDLGFTPQACAIIGLQPTQATAILTAVQGAQDAGQAIATQRQLHDALGAQATAIADILVQGGGDEALVEQYLALRGQAEAALVQAENLRGALFAQVTQGLPQAAVQGLIRLRNGAGHAVPIEFAVRERTPEQWRAITKALRAEARAQRLGEQVPPEPAQLLASVRSDPLVVQAAANLQANLPAMELIFDQVAQGVDGP